MVCKILHHYFSHPVIPVLDFRCNVLHLEVTVHPDISTSTTSLLSVFCVPAVNYIKHGGLEKKMDRGRVSNLIHLVTWSWEWTLLTRAHFNLHAFHSGHTHLPTHPNRIPDILMEGRTESGEKKPRRPFFCLPKISTCTRKVKGWQPKSHSTKYADSSITKTKKTNKTVFSSHIKKVSFWN